MTDYIASSFISSAFNIVHLHGLEEVSYKEDELVVVCLVRNGRPYVRSFVEHYFSLGVKHIVFLDNGSTDGTVSAVTRYDNVTVLRTELPFKAFKGEGQTLMRKYLIERFGKGRWSLCVDMDELFDYPYSDVIGLDSLLDYLNSKSYTAVTAHMLDMFAERPVLSEQPGESDEPLKEVHRFYDISRLRKVRRGKDHDIVRNNTFESDEISLGFQGGIRDNVFGFKPWLTKYPLVFSDGSVKPSPPHKIYNAKIADLTCVLFHYKFLKHFREQATRAAREKRYWKNSIRYKRYLEVLQRNPSLQLKQEASQEITSVNDLLEDRFLVVSDDYVSWVNAEEEKSVLQSSQGEPRGLADAFLESRRQGRARILRVGRLEQQLREARRQQKAKTQRIGRLEQQLCDRDKKIQRTKGKLQRLTQRNQRLTEQVRRRVRELDSIRASRAWKLVEALRRLKISVHGLRRRLS